MAYVFISYSIQDEDLANWLYRSCNNFNIETFLASISLNPGNKWKEEILQNLKESKWFFFLATPNSIRSDAVKHEIGAALALNKNIIPILHNLDFPDLPTWISEFQGIKIINDDVEHLKILLANISEKINADKIVTGLLVGVLIGAGMYFLSK